MAYAPVWHTLLYSNTAATATAIDMITFLFIVVVSFYNLFLLFIFLLYFCIYNYPIKNRYERI